MCKHKSGLRYWQVTKCACVRARLWVFSVCWLRRRGSCWYNEQLGADDAPTPSHQIQTRSLCLLSAGRATFSPLPFPSQSSPGLRARPPRSPWPKPLIYIMPPKSELFHTTQSQAETWVTATSSSQLFIQLLSADIHTRIGNGTLIDERWRQQTNDSSCKHICGHLKLREIPLKSSQSAAKSSWHSPPTWPGESQSFSSFS